MVDVQNKRVGANLIFDKSNWNLVKFDEVAFQKKGTVDRGDTTITKYIKGEHMGSEDLHVREWGRTNR
jgi:type I restriction enzyme S subunit